MKLLKRSIPLWVVLLIILVSGSALALVYMTAQMTMQATIKATGTLKLYSDSGCTTEMPATFNWGELDPSSGDVTVPLDVWIKNTGNSKAYVRYYLTGTDWVWDSTGKYYWKALAPASFFLYLKQQPANTDWIPKTMVGETVIEINAGANQKVTFTLKAKSGALPQMDSFSVYFESSNA